MLEVKSLEMSLSEVSKIVAAYLVEKKNLTLFSSLKPYFNSGNELCFKYDYADEIKID